jgi:hypothetical protein
VSWGAALDRAGVTPAQFVYSATLSAEHSCKLLHYEHGGMILEPTRLTLARAEREGAALESAAGAAPARFADLVPTLKVLAKASVLMHPERPVGEVYLSRPSVCMSVSLSAWLAGSQSSLTAVAAGRPCALKAATGYGFLRRTCSRTSPASGQDKVGLSTTCWFGTFRRHRRPGRSTCLSVCLAGYCNLGEFYTLSAKPANAYRQYHRAVEVAEVGTPACPLLVEKINALLASVQHVRHA